MRVTLFIAAAPWVQEILLSAKRVNSGIENLAQANLASGTDVVYVTLAPVGEQRQIRLDDVAHVGEIARHGDSAFH